MVCVDSTGSVIDTIKSGVVVSEGLQAARLLASGSVAPVAAFLPVPGIIALLFFTCVGSLAAVETAAAELLSGNDEDGELNAAALMFSLIMDPMELFLFMLEAEAVVERAAALTR